MKNYGMLICFVFLISFAQIVYAQNETINETINETNITGSCGDGIIQQELNEQCDDGEENGIICSADYGGECNYCSDTCGLISVKGAFCGDGNTDTEEECDDGNSENSDYCSNECKKTYECSFNSDCDDNNDCTEDVCQEGKCKNQNNDRKRIGNKYCLNGNQEKQKAKNAVCNENYECLTNTCSGGYCVELAKEPNFLEKIINWFLKLIGLAK